MSSQEIRIKKKTLIFTGVTVLLVLSGIIYFNNQSDKLTGKVIKEDLSNIEIVFNSLSPQAKALYYKQSEELTKEVPERIVELDELKIGCFGTNTITQMSNSDTNLGGQCCGALKDFEAYEVQLKSLKKFIEENGNIDLIPKDPYDIPVEHSKNLIQFDKDIQLNSEQQKTYESAVKMSHHGGPCCCKCWKWYVMSGLAKKLIVDYDWDDLQISELWDTSSSCGHDEDTNMNKHYDVDENEDKHDHNSHDH
jgi:hypothetical protein